MKIHTNELMGGDIISAANTIPAPFQCWLTDEGFGSRSHDRAYVVRCTGSHKVAPQGMPGHKAATYDEWGLFLAELFSRDPGMKAGNYNGAQDFIAQTKGAYPVAGFDSNGTPDDDR